MVVTGLEAFLLSAGKSLRATTPGLLLADVSPVIGPVPIDVGLPGTPEEAGESPCGCKQRGGMEAQSCGIGMRADGCPGCVCFTMLANGASTCGGPAATG